MKKELEQIESDYNDSFFTVFEAIEAAYQLGKSEDRWISVDEGLPEESGYVLTHCCYTEIKSCYYSSEFKTFHNAYGIQNYVRHWQPLPPLPTPPIHIKSDKGEK